MSGLWQPPPGRGWRTLVDGWRNTRAVAESAMPELARLVDSRAMHVRSVMPGADLSVVGHSLALAAGTAVVDLAEPGASPRVVVTVAGMVGEALLTAALADRLTVERIAGAGRPYGEPA